MNNLERRFSQPNIKLSPTEEKRQTIAGYAAVFNSDSEDLNGFFTERIEFGAFKKTLKEADVRALVEHDPRWLLGNTKSGTLRLSEDEHGLKFEIDPPDTVAGRDVLESLRRGDLSSMSFGFRTIRDKWEQHYNKKIRTLLEVQLFDVSLVSFPAYPDTSVALRFAQKAGIILDSGNGTGLDNANIKLAEPELVSTHRRIDTLRKKLETIEKQLL